MRGPTSDPTVSRTTAARAATVAGCIAAGFGLLFGSSISLGYLHNLAQLGMEASRLLAHVATALSWPWWVPPWYGWTGSDAAAVAFGFGALVVAVVVTYVLTRWLLIDRPADPSRAFWTGWFATVAGAGAGGLVQLLPPIIALESVLFSFGTWAPAYGVLWGMVVGLLVGAGVRRVVAREPRTGSGVGPA